MPLGALAWWLTERALARLPAVHRPAHVDYAGIVLLSTACVALLACVTFPLRIVRGGETSVTDFFAAKTRSALSERLLPVVAAQTGRLQLAARYDAIARRGALFGFVKPEDASVDRYVTRRALDALYRRIGDEERRIRADPAGTGSAVLRAVFGGR